jgi:hypothetical protein
MKRTLELPGRIGPI